MCTCVQTYLCFTRFLSSLNKRVTARVGLFHSFGQVCLAPVVLEPSGVTGLACVAAPRRLLLDAIFGHPPAVLVTGNASVFNFSDYDGVWTADVEVALSLAEDAVVGEVSPHK